MSDSSDDVPMGGMKGYEDMIYLVVLTYGLLVTSVVTHTNKQFFLKLLLKDFRSVILVVCF